MIVSSRLSFTDIHVNIIDFREIQDNVNCRYFYYTYSYFNV